MTSHAFGGQPVDAAAASGGRTSWHPSWGREAPSGKYGVILKIRLCQAMRICLKKSFSLIRFFYYKHLLHTIQRLNSEQTIKRNGKLKGGVQPPLI